jgi:hypothetical protein
VQLGLSYGQRKCANDELLSYFQVETPIHRLSFFLFCFTIVYMTKKNQDNSFNFIFQIGNDRQSKRLLANLGRILLFHYYYSFFIKTCTGNIKAKSKRYHWIQKIPVLKRLFIQNFCKRNRYLEEK